ncbi:MAG: hypothetical protein AAF697_05125 [Pseudomonadota bacterium]
MQAADIPPPPPVIVLESEQAGATSIDLPTESGPLLRLEERSDDAVIIDLTTLVPSTDECFEEREPDPFQPEILVCRQTQIAPRLDSTYGPSAEEMLEGSAVPRASVRLSEDAELEANVIKQGVGGFDADGVEARVRIGF